MSRPGTQCASFCSALAMKDTVNIKTWGWNVGCHAPTKFILMNQELDAAKAGDLVRVDQMLVAGANIETMNDQGDPLLIAVKFGHR